MTPFVETVSTACRFVPWWPRCNPGSCGHPSLCARPCIYVAKNGSCHVDGCSFCHLQHERPVHKLNQRQRHVLQQLDRRSKMDLLVSTVCEGFWREGLADRAGNLIRLLEEEASKHPQGQGMPKQKRHLHDLRKALSRMILADAFKAFEDILPDRVLESFQALRLSMPPQIPQIPDDESLSMPPQIPDGETTPTKPAVTKCELTLKEALSLFPAPEIPVSWIL
ncbi:hypothetical protein AK812_SmicGene36481 [Symbiodinium microadriaticum]|uniref:C3H1-type domain-containing protein n=1 Tax=Symbiodinium microadriaticum TaxID=2951 RepID=A0A1Q9CIT1_SYMMI|nr:hypothetical protein AK812_SmicGene36481 [Symbiodinium microadriaticum]